MVGTVEKLEQHIGILVQPRQLEQLSRRLKVVTAELERVQELQAKDATTTGISADAENKVLCHSQDFAIYNNEHGCCLQEVTICCM